MTSDRSVDPAVADPTAPFRRPTAIAFIVALFVVGPAVFLVLPAVVGALEQSYDFSELELGVLASADLGGSAIAAVTALYWRERWNWKRVALVSLLVATAGNLLVTVFTDFLPFLAIRFVVGCAGGMLLAIIVAFIAYTADPDRVAGIMVIAQVLFTAVGFALCPWLVDIWGADGLFATFAAMTGICAVFVRLVPAGPPGVDHGHTGVLDWRTYVPGALVLVGLSLFFIAVGGFWAFIELMGEESPLSEAEVATALSISSLVSVAGAFVPTLVGDRYGRAPMLLGAAALQLAGLAYLGTAQYAFVVFLFFLTAYQFGWTMSVPYQFGVMVERDATKSMIVLLPTFQAGGITLGPIIMGAVIERLGFAGVPLVAGLFILAYLVVILPLARVRRAGADVGG